MKGEETYIDFTIKFKREKGKPINVKVGNVSKATLSHFFGSIKQIEGKLSEEKNVTEREIKKILLRKG